ncbi:hypothetical protein PLESTB_001163800 [Pleodorina starrii]|uniref:Formiminotransferase N-terminal subdomain domain-containing protein n=1 Tax=Pleodorina starrii TaxID=330485 RepID=A0A9W6F560_9CHLO|nr:hypothetical protein PLESTM_000239800 [Pleodorina starrii]GLC56923.1 hypothetical protein PLESTB_001163800 [Pleodorina starrii]
MSVMNACSLSLRSLLPRICNRRCTLPLVLRTYASMHAYELDSALGCNVYISEGRDKELIKRLQAEASATEHVALANVFVDAPYNRTGFTLVSTHADLLTAAVVRLSRAALRLLDLRSHAATHPRLGVVDHISLHPLGSLVKRPAAAAGAAAAPSPWPSHPEDHYHHHHHHQHQHQHQQRQHGHPPGPPGQPGHQEHGRLGQQHGGAALHQRHHYHHQVAQRQQEQQVVPGGGALTGGGAGGAYATVWEPPPPGLAGLAVAASCAQYIAWHLSREDDSELAAAAQQPSGGGDGPPAAAALGPAPALPVYLYGYAHPTRRCLSDVRRELGYFRRAADGGWGGLSDTQQLPDPGDLQRFPPDLGPVELPPQSGLVTIGAVPWVVNYNVPLQDVDMEEAKWLARAVSTRGGGLPGVEAMALQHSDDSVEVACNLLDESLSSPHAVQARLEALASARGLDQWAVLWGYRTNKSPEELLRAAVALEAEAAWRRG